MKPTLHLANEGLTCLKHLAFLINQMFHQAVNTTSAKKGLLKDSSALLAIRIMSAPWLQSICRYSQTLALKLHWKRGDLWSPDVGYGKAHTQDHPRCSSIV